MKIIQRTLYFAAASCFLFVAYYHVWFLRQPTRNIPNNNSEFVSPANGKIVSIKNWKAEAIVETKGIAGAINVWTKDVDTAGIMISIQMNVANVHYQRVPVSGKVISKTYTHGDFSNAVTMSNEYGIRFENEHNEMLFETVSGVRYKLVQIAGFVARRIEDYIQPGQAVEQGDVIGLIKLGSQVTVILPHNASIKAAVGDIVVDGETVLALF